MIDATEAEVQAAVDQLKSLSLVVESSGGRVMRYAQNVGKVLGVPPQAVAILAVLFLRGPQTAGELRINTERLHRFGDILAVEGFLNELAERPAGALVKLLPRLPGARESRWAHLLSGEVAAAEAPASAPASGGADALDASELATLKANVDRLEGEVAALRALLERLCREVGFTP